MVALASAFIRLRPQADKAEFRKSGEEMGAEAGKGAGDNFGSEFTRGSDGKLRDSRGKFVKDSEKSGTEAGSKTGKSFSKSFAKETKSGSGTSVFSRVLQTTAAKYTLIGGAAAASLPSVLRFTAALAPAAGAVVVLPAALTAGAVAASTFKVAISGVSDAIKAGFTGNAKQAQKALDALPPSARKFASAIVALRPEVEKLRAAVSQKFFAPFANSIKPLVNQYFPVIRQQMSSVAGGLGQLAKQFVLAARSSDTLKTVHDVFLATRLSLDQLRGAVQPLTKAFSALIQSTAPELPRIALGLERMARAVASFISDAVDSGKVNAVFDAARVTIGQLVRTLTNVGFIFAQVFKAASVGSGGLLSNLEQLTGQASRFLQSAQGIGALGAVFGTLNKIGAGLRASLGAVLPAIAQSLAVLGPAIAGLVDPAVLLVRAIAPLLPIFAGLAATIIIKLTPALASLAGYLAQHTGAVKAATAAVAAFLVVQKAAATATAIQAAGSLIKYIQTIKIVTTLTKVWTGVQAAFNLVLDANPIGLVVVAIAALAAGFIYAYKHSQTFRDIVQGALHGIVVAGQAVASFFTGVVWPALVTAFNAIKGAALFLWHNVFEPVWHGIMAVVNVAVTIVRGYINLLVAEFNVVKTAVLFLYNNIFAPVFRAITKVLQIFQLAAEIVFKAFTNIIRNDIIATVNFLRPVFAAVFSYIGNVVTAWWHVAQAAFSAFRTYVIGPIVQAVNYLRGVFVGVFNAITGAITSWYRAHIIPVFQGVRAAFDTLAAGFSSIYNGKIKPVFNAFIGFIRNTVVGGFKAGVDAIRTAWAAVQEAAAKPVRFVVHNVINPFINGLNNAARIVGVKDRVAPIAGFRTGGQIEGYAAGGKISGSGGISDNRQAMIPGVGAVQLQGGEFVVRREVTAQALPLLQWLNAGMKGGGPRKAQQLIGRPMADMPGDGSEGFAFRSGGLVGWVKDVWDAVSHPLDAIKAPFQAALGGIPGSGTIKDFLVGAADKVLDGAVSWLSRLAGGGGKVGDAVKFLHQQDGKPYVWASAGPGGYDCSGIVSAVYNILHGKNPYGHTFSTESAASYFPKPGQAGQMAAAWSHPGQAPAGATVGHMMGRVGNQNFESTGSRGVHLKNTRSLSDFANIGHYRSGGMFGKPIQLFDQGGLWPTGTLGANLSGHTEYVDPKPGAGGGDTFIFGDGAFAGAIMTNSKQAEDLVVTAINSAKKRRRL